jgi:A1 cistron-splicing factor AAR2
MSNGVETEQMSPDEAMRRLNETASIVCLNVPPKTEFGIDMRTWVVDENFQGLKFVPPGLHFFHWR